MHSQSWRLLDAKNQFSKVVEAALHGEPQHVTRRGREVVVIVAADEYVRLKKCLVSRIRYYTVVQASRQAYDIRQLVGISLI